MSALANLRAVVAEEASRAAEDERERREAKRQQDLERLRQKVAARCVPELLEELGAKFYVNGLSPFLQLTYRERSHSWRGNSDFVDGLPRSVVGWVERVETQISKEERARSERRETIFQDLATAQNEVRLDVLKKNIEKYGLIEVPEIEGALRATVERLAEIQRQEEEAVHRSAEELLTRTLAMIEPVPGWGRTLEAIECELNRLDFNLVSDGLVIEILDALEAANERLERESVRIEARRRQAQVEAFWPFQYYEIVYGIVAEDEVGDRYLETNSFDTLNPTPDEDGWYMTTYGRRVKSLNVCLVWQNTVDDPHVLPSWCPREETEVGQIRVPPPDAEEFFPPNEIVKEQGDDDKTVV
jgi:dihydroxyacetone kinase DhaKLM complex PTS-EIIA-like component DhaM